MSFHILRKPSMTMASVLLLIFFSAGISQAQTSGIMLKHGTADVVQLEKYAGDKSDAPNLASQFREYASGASYEGTSYLLLQFDDLFDASGREELQNLGINLLQYVPNKTYLASLSRETSLQILRERGLVGYYQPSVENKMSAGFFKALSEPGFEVMVRATYTSNMTFSAVQNAISAQVPGVALRPHPKFEMFTATLTGDMINTLAEFPFITAVEAHSDDYEHPTESVTSEYDEGSLGDAFNSTSRANFVKSKLPGFPGLTGSGVVIGVGDSPYDGATHVDLLGRHTNLSPGKGNNGPIGNHGNHTSGTAAGNGSRVPRFQGVATGATVYTAVTGDIFTLGMDQPVPMDVSSNSWNTSDPMFSDWYEEKGQYNINSAFIDKLLYEETALVSVHSIGNSGGTQDGYPQNYLLMNPSYGAAKNAFVVGRLTHGYDNRLTYGTAAPYGPTRDGRIKPDIVAQQRIFATIDSDDYGLKGGSSMSTPTVAGVAALVYERFGQQNSGTKPDGSLVKATLMNTADYLETTGPNFRDGFGRVNARRAVEVIDNVQYFSQSIDTGQMQGFNVNVPASVDGKGIAQIKIMLYWSDMEASPYSDPALVNNLDLVVNDGSGNVLPWVLDTTPANVALQATRGIDVLNNAEQITLDNPAAGNIDITVHGTSVPLGPQMFYVVYSYVLDELVLTHPVGGEKFFAGEWHATLWDSDESGTTAKADNVEYSLDNGFSWTPYQDLQLVEGGAVWKVPEVPLKNALVRITKGGAVSTSQPLTISERLDLTVSDSGTNDIKFMWNPVDGAASYNLLKLESDAKWTTVASTADTMVTVQRAVFSSRSTWLSVQAVDATTLITSQRAEAVRFVSSNTAPVAVPDEVTLTRTGRTEIDVLANDTDADSDMLYLISATDGLKGEAVVTDNDRVWYYADSTFSGTDTVNYTISDGVGGTAEGMIVIGFPVPNSSPTIAQAVADQQMITGDPPLMIDLTPVFTDSDGDPLSYSVTSSQESFATASIQSNSVAIVAIAEGASTITVTADDGRGGMISTAFQVTVVANQVPVVSQALTDIELMNGVPPVVINLQPVFADGDGDALTYAALSDNTVAVTVSVSDANLMVQGIAVGEATVTVTASDGRGGIVPTTFKAVVVPATALIPEDIPTEFALFQNYPNPFNPVTVIGYSLPEATSVSLEIFDVRGRLVRTLVNSVQAAGRYEMQFDAGQGSSGLYFYKLTTPQYQETREMFVIK